MNIPSLVLYCTSAAADLAALHLVVRHVPERLRALRQPIGPEPEPPMIYNESLTAVQRVLAARSPAMIDARVRSSLNEIIDALASEASARSEADRRLESLTDAPKHRLQLLSTVALLTIGSVLGIAGNIVGSLR